MKYQCDGYDNITYVESLLSISINHVTVNTTSGNRIKTRKTLNSPHCTMSNFYNEFNASFDTNNFNEAYCPNETDLTISGVYIDNVFRYYEIGVSVAKEENANEIMNIFKAYECRIQIHYVDTTVNVYDYNNPIKRTIKSQLVTLKSNVVAKMNFYFKLQSFDSYENYLFDSHSTMYYMGYSSIEQYDNDKGNDRFDTKYNDYALFAKVYLRAALERTIIQRKYMKLTEFAANMSSILSEILLVLYVLVRYINRLYAQQSIIRKIFQFRGLSDDEKKKKFINKMKELSEKKILKVNKYKVSNSSINNNTDGKSNVTDDCSQIASSNNVIMNKSHLSVKKANKEIVYKKVSTAPKFQKLRTISKMQINLFEIGISLIVPCCRCKRLQRKEEMFKKGYMKIFFQLDVLTYLRKMQQIELLSYILLDHHESQMVNFLSKPSISTSNQKDVFDYLQLQYNVDINEKEINEFNNYFNVLIDKEHKSDIESRLLELAKMQVSNLVFN